MQAIADHVYHILIIAFVAATVLEAIVKFGRRPRKKKRGPVAPREGAVEREKRMRERYAAFGERWREWLDQPRGSGDAGRLVTAASIWGSPEQGVSFPRRFHDAQLGKVMLDKRAYLAMLNAPADAVQPRRELAPTSWATMRLDVWALHSKAAQKPRLMRVWLSGDRALVELVRASSRLTRSSPARSSASSEASRASARARAKSTACVGCPPRRWSWEPSPSGIPSVRCGTSPVWLPRGRPSPMP